MSEAAVVHLDVERVGVFGVGKQREVVVARSGFARRLVGSRHQVHNLLRDRADPVGGDDVAGERHAVGAVRIAGGGVVDHYRRGQSQAGAQVAGPPAAGRDGAEVGVGFVVRDPQKIAEEEDLVLLDRSADVAAEIVVGKMSHRGIEEVARVQRAVAQELVAGAVEFVGAGFQNHVGIGAAGAAQRRFVVAGGDVDRLNGFQRRNHDLQQAGALVIVDTFDLVAVPHAHLAVDFGLQRTGGVEELRMLEACPRGAGHQVQQRLIIALGAQRKRGRLHHLQLRAGIGTVGLQQRRRARDFHGFRNIAGRQLHIDTRAAVDRERDIFPVSFLKPGRLHRDRVLSRRHIREAYSSRFRWFDRID